MDSVSKYETSQSPIKPSTDKKKYKYIKLNNGLKTLLISGTSYDLSILDKEARLENIEKHKPASYGDNHAVHDFEKRLQRSISVEDRIVDANGQNMEPSKSLNRSQSVQDVMKQRSDGTCKVPDVDGNKIHFGRSISVDDCYKDENLNKTAFEISSEKTFEVEGNTEAEENSTYNSSGLKLSAASLCIGVGSYSDPDNILVKTPFLNLSKNTEVSVMQRRQTTKQHFISISNGTISMRAWIDLFNFSYRPC